MSDRENPLRSLDYAMLQQCMHCAMCLPSCPTYVETKNERNSPRGRIALMRSIVDGDLTTTESFGQEMYYCLGCLACTTACPAGVDYAPLFEASRTEIERRGVLSNPKRKGIRFIALKVFFMHPKLLRALCRMIWAFQASGVQSAIRSVSFTSMLPERLRQLELQMPKVARRFSNELIKPVEDSCGELRMRVAVLTGCVQDLVYSEINRATVDVLRENGCEVHTHPGQPCCGSLHAHNGDLQSAKVLAKRLIDLVSPERYDAIISNAGGCGSHLRHFDRLLSADPTYSARAALWSARVRDIHEYLVECGFRRPVQGTLGPVTVTYHESCHLCHGQKVSRQPREILRAIPGVELRECSEANWCCGSAGIYNLTHPSTAGWLQERKVAHLRATGAEFVATANPGCHLQIENGLRASEGPQLKVVHPIVLLAEAYRRDRSLGTAATSARGIGGRSA